MADEIRAIATARRICPADHRLWRGEIALGAMHDPDFDINPSVIGCGVLCSNFAEDALMSCAKLGTMLGRIYSDARFPDGSTGALGFWQPPF